MIARATERPDTGDALSSRSVQVVVRSALGLALGISLGFIGFGDYGELSRMFTLRDIRLYLTFGGAVAVTAVGLRYFVPYSLPARPMHRAVPVGAALFGVGWALGGACPGIALVQLGEGTVAASVTLAGMFAGIRLYDWLNARWLHWGTRSCGG